MDRELLLPLISQVCVYVYCKLSLPPTHTHSLVPFNGILYFDLFFENENYFNVNMHARNNKKKQTNRR